MKSLQTGRRVGSTCRRDSRLLRTRPRCTREVSVKGSFERAGVAGSNSFRFSGRISRRSLKPGRYRLYAKVLSAGASRSARFSITR